MGHRLLFSLKFWTVPPIEEGMNANNAPDTRYHTDLTRAVPMADQDRAVWFVNTNGTHVIGHEVEGTFKPLLKCYTEEEANVAFEEMRETTRYVLGLAEAA